MQNYRERLRLGDLLIEYELITKDQLQDALDTQKIKGGKLGEVLIDKGYVTKKNINEVLEYQLGIPFIDLNEYEVSKEATKTITESLARRHNLLPIKKNGNELYVAMEDPLNIFAIDDVEIFSGMEIVPMLASEEQITRAIDIYYGKQQANKAAEQYKQENLIEINTEIDEDDEEQLKSAPIVKLINTVLEQGVRHRASDIHIEPYEKNIRIRYRIDGQLKQMFDYEKTLLNAIIARIKIMASMDIAEKRKPQDGRISINVDKTEYDVRISSIPTIYGEKIVMRINNKESFTKGKKELGLFDDDLEKFNEILQNPHGIILVTGPTGSGKSTTLYTVLKEINREDINIVTVEDPVEAKIKGINQIQVNNKVDLTFANALRSILRQDPDVIMIGEIRDRETAEIAVKSSATGHLVVSTLHTNDASSSITRLVDMGVDSYLISASVVGVIAQRLVRRLCNKCKEEFILSDYEKQLLNEPLDKDISIYKPKGCHFCDGTGYSGRIGVYEIMPVHKDIRKLINEHGTTDDIKDLAISHGMKTLKTNVVRLVIEGTTSIEEMIRVAYEIE